MMASSEPRLRTARLVTVLALAATLVAPFVVRGVSDGEPSALVASEVDALEGGVRLAEALTSPGDTRLKERLRDGVKPPPGHPRLERLMGGDEGRRLVLVPPAPRWIAALGVSGLPGSDATPNGQRASVAAALLFALAGLVLALHLGPLRALGLSLLLIAIPDARDAMSAYGYGASAVLGTTLLLVGLDRTVRGDARVGPATAAWTAALVMAGLGLVFGTHPFMIAATLGAWLAVGLGRAPADTDGGPNPLLRVPRLPLSLLLWPVGAIALLVAMWPALWAGTGKRLVAYVIEAGVFAADAQTFGALSFEQVTGRAPQAFSAFVQLAGWTPLPVLGLATAGLLKAARPLRAVLLAGILTPLLVGSLDGGLLGARLSLWPMLWVPLAWAALVGGEALVAGVPCLARVVGGAARPALSTGLAGLATAGLLELGGISTLSAKGTGLEAAWPLPLALFDAHSEGAGGVAFSGGARGFGPGVDVLRDHLERGWANSEDGAAAFRLVVGGAGLETHWRGLPMALEPAR